MNATLRFHYFDAELNGSNENTMVLWRSVNGSTNWIAQTIANRNTTANWVETSVINAFSSWTSANTGVLPVKLLTFTGAKRNDTHELTWVTATEQNASNFEIQVALAKEGENVVDWKTIGNVRAAGNSNTTKSYTFDNNFRTISPIQEGTREAYYYRLKIIDFDGSFEYSNTIMLLENGKQVTVIAFPNPSETGVFTLSGKIFERTDAVVKNVLGQTINVVIKSNQLDLSEMPAGAYFVRIAGENNIIRVVKL